MVIIGGRMHPVTEKTLSFTTTAMPRPEIVEATYTSFTRNLVEIDFSKVTLYLNVDNFPNKRDADKRQVVVDIARKYFGNVVVNLPEEPNFAAAVKWCFSKVETFYNFHLEDDWMLLTPLKISMFNQFFLAPHVQQVGLRAWRFAKNNFWLSPSVIRGDFCRKVSEKMKTDSNPEVQIRTLKSDYRDDGFLLFPFEYKSVVLRDLGRNWMQTQEFDRGHADFTKWTIREKGKGKQRLADQNSHIPKELSTNSHNKKYSLNNKKQYNNDRKRSVQVTKKGKQI